MRLAIILAIALMACAKPKPPAMVPQEVEVTAKPKPSIPSYGHQFAETPAKVRTGPTILFGLDDSRVRADIDTDFLIGAKRITLTGHACPLGSDAYNLALSLRRAESVKANLVKSGVDPQAITTVAKGESEPLPGDYALSRRVEITFTLR